MEATARIVASAAGSGTTTLAVLRGEPPLLPRRTYGGGDAVEVHLVGGAAGPLGGDRLCLHIEVGPGASLIVRTVAAMLALPGPSGTQSLLSVRASVRAGGRLAWLPEPIVAAAGCHHLSESTVQLATGASLLWREEVIAGRHDEAPGRLHQRTTIRLDGRALLRQDLALGADADGWNGPAVLGGARTVGHLVIVDPAWLSSGVPGPAVVADAARMPLEGPAVLCSAVAADAPSLRRALTDLGP